MAFVLSASENENSGVSEAMKDDAYTKAYIARRYAETEQLDALAPGRYFDGTYEWEYEGDGYWSASNAPYGMPSRPKIENLRRATTTYVPVEFPTPGSVIDSASVVAQDIETLDPAGLEEMIDFHEQKIEYHRDLIKKLKALQAVVTERNKK